MGFDQYRDRSEWRCRSCGYGLIVRGTLPSCPMCRSYDWAQIPGAAYTTPGITSLIRSSREAMARKSGSQS
jgi:hypothetical protein